VKTYAQYKNYKKPRWAPPAWVFGPVWSLLYLLIIVSFGYVAYLLNVGAISFAVVVPFLLNLIFNLIYSPIQFRLHNFALGALDVFLVLATLIWALWAIYPIAPWVFLINIPYLVWVSFATVLQITITTLNWSR